jgi:hypothetical protein
LIRTFARFLRAFDILNMISKNRLLLLPLAALAALLPLRAAHGQVASFSLSDGVGSPTSGSYNAGTSFSLAITLGISTGSAGYSLWFDTAAANASFFSISGFTIAVGSPFSDPTSANGAQSFNTANGGRPNFLSNLNDLGYTTPGGTTAAAGSYAVETINFLIAANTPAGIYTIQTTPAASGGRASGSSDASFNFIQAPSAIYTITVVPEPSTWALLAGGALALGATTAARRQRATRQAGK